MNAIIMPLGPDNDKTIEKGKKRKEATEKRK